MESTLENRTKVIPESGSHLDPQHRYCSISTRGFVAHRLATQTQSRGSLPRIPLEFPLLCQLERIIHFIASQSRTPLCRVPRYLHTRCLRLSLRGSTVFSIETCNFHSSTAKLVKTLVLLELYIANVRALAECFPTRV